MLTRNIVRILRRARFLTESVRSRLEASALEDPKKAYQYARLIVGGPRPKGEAVIAEDAKLSFHYALNTLHGRFEAGEEALSNSRVWFVDYWIHVLNKEWPEPRTEALERARVLWVGNDQRGR